MALTEEGLIEVPGLDSRWVRLPGGVRAHYMTAGSSGPSVVLLHGGLRGSSGLAGWRFMAPALADAGFRVFCPDMPSFGLTEDPDFFYTPGKIGHRDFIHDFTTALGLDRFHLAGNSMGGNNTINYVLAHPDRVISFILIACETGDIADFAELMRLVPPDTSLPVHALNVGGLYDGTKESMRLMLESIIYRNEVLTDDLLEMRVRAANHHEEGLNRGQYGGNKPERMFQWDANTLASVTTKDRLDKVTIPGLYLHGKQDVLQPVGWGYVREDRLPNIQFFYPDECGHQGQTDQPEMHQAVFIEFFRDGKVSRTTAEWAGVSKRRPELPGIIGD